MSRCLIGHTGVKAAPTSLLRHSQLPYNLILNTCRSLGITQDMQIKFPWKTTLPSIVMISLLMIMAVVCLWALVKPSTTSWKHVVSGLRWDRIQSRPKTCDFFPFPFSYVNLVKIINLCPGVKRIDLVTLAFSTPFTYLGLLDMYNSYYGQKITIIPNERCQFTGLSEVFSGGVLGAGFHVLKAVNHWFQFSSMHLPPGPTELC